MQDKDLQPIHLIAQELSEKTVELANYKVAYVQVNAKLEELTKLEEIINSNKELKELVEEIKNKEDK